MPGTIEIIWNNPSTFEKVRSQKSSISFGFRQNDLFCWKLLPSIHIVYVFSSYDAPVSAHTSAPQILRTTKLDGDVSDSNVNKLILFKEAFPSPLDLEQLGH
ncbi:hypothetical protein NPIL_544571 [Nephila pilipes]|uniref:Uncharacterized protein n=1 Tax=Nephila pilipes TaxID=299642 RepID=A0A8X6R6D4_NEPPI|nr:hypothetical protein NPIL_544571 [Nephila pilipes]